MSGVFKSLFSLPLPFISSVFLLFMSFLTFNLNISHPLSFICRLPHLCSFFFPSSVVLVSLFSSPFALVHLLAFFIYIFPSLSHNSCALPSLCLSLSPRLSLPLYLSPVSSLNLRGKALSVSLWTFLSKSVTTFSVGCLILSKASKRGKKRGRAYSKSCSQVEFFFFLKESRGFKKVSSFWY